LSGVIGIIIVLKVLRRDSFLYSLIWMNY